MKAPKGYLFIDEFAERVGFHRVHIYRMIKKKEVPVFKFKKHRYISEKQVKLFVG